MTLILICYSVTYQESKNTPRVRIPLEPFGSTFVVFQKSSLGIDPVVTLKLDGKSVWSMLKNKIGFRVSILKQVEKGLCKKAIEVLNTQSLIFDMMLNL